MSPQAGLSITHRRYIPRSHAHYGGDLLDGAYSLGLFGDVATDLLIHTDSDEGLFAGYTSVEFLAPIRAGDVLEVTATLIRVGQRSRDIQFEAKVVCRATPENGPSAAIVLDPSIVATRARGTVVAPARR